MSRRIQDLLASQMVMTLEFSFTDGMNWDGPYKIIMEVSQMLKGLPQCFIEVCTCSDYQEYEKHQFH